MKFQYQHGDRPLDGYTILRGIGRGGFGEVYFAVSDGGKEAALKAIFRDHDVELRGSIHCQNLKHPNLVSIHDIRKLEDGSAFIIMEHMRGPTLREMLRNRPGGLSPEEAIGLARQIAAGLQCLHDHGIVHRDLKPENIFCEEGAVKIGDYGLAKFISSSRQACHTASLGTTHYMAPEIGTGVYGHAVDLYALGVILYELLTGRLPFRGDAYEVWTQHLLSQPDLEPLPANFRPFLARALDKEPGRRQASARQFADELQHLPDPAERQAAPTAPVHSGRRLSPTWTMAAAGVLLFLTFLFLAGSFSRRDDPAQIVESSRPATLTVIHNPETTFFSRRLPEGVPPMESLLADGMHRLRLGDVAAAERSFLDLQSRVARLDARAGPASWLGDLATFLSDERSGDYAGEDYERILLHALLALSEAVRDGDQAVSYCKQTLALQDSILNQPSPDRTSRAYKSGYRKIGLPAYLLGLMQERKGVPGRESARLQYRRVSEWEPQFASIARDLERLDGAGPRPPDRLERGTLCVFVLAGNAPRKIERSVVAPAAAAEIAAQLTRMVPALQDRFGATIDLAPIRIPALEPDPASPSVPAGVRIDGAEAGSLDILTDVSATAIQQHRVMEDWILAKALMRRMLKKSVVTAAKGAGREIAADAEAPRWTHMLIEAGGLAANTFWSALERADSRTWSGLPGSIQVLRADLPAGRHTVEVLPGPVSEAGSGFDSTAVEIQAGKNTFLICLMQAEGAPPAFITNHPALLSDSAPPPAHAAR